MKKTEAENIVKFLIGLYPVGIDTINQETIRLMTNSFHEMMHMHSASTVKKAIKVIAERETGLAVMPNIGAIKNELCRVEAKVNDLVRLAQLKLPYDKLTDVCGLTRQEYDEMVITLDDYKGDIKAKMQEYVETILRR